MINDYIYIVRRCPGKPWAACTTRDRAILEVKLSIERLKNRDRTGTDLDPKKSWTVIEHNLETTGEALIQLKHAGKSPYQIVKIPIL